MHPPSPPETPPLRLVVLDFPQLVAEGLGSLISQCPDMRVLGCFSSASAALDDASAPLHQAAIAVVNIHLEGGYHGPALRELRTAHHDLPIVWVCDPTSALGLLEVARISPAHLVHKEDSASHLVHAIRAAAAGHPYRSPTAHQLLTDIKSLPPPAPKILSPREQTILALIAGGLGNAEIAARLGLAPSTAQTHRRNIMGKLGLRTTAALQAHAQRLLANTSPLPKTSPRLPAVSAGSTHPLP